MMRSSISIATVSPMSIVPTLPFSARPASSSNNTPASSAASCRSMTASRLSLSAPMNVPKWMAGSGRETEPCQHRGQGQGGKMMRWWRH